RAIYQRLCARAGDKADLPIYANGRRFFESSLLRIMQKCRGATPDGRDESALSTAALEPHDMLSEREAEVLRLVAAGLANREIACRLVVTPGTVKKHLEHIYGKLDVHSRTAALAKARALGIHS